MPPTAAAAAAIVAVPAASMPSSIPPPIITPRFDLHPPRVPDLTIGRPATWYTGAERDVWLNPLIEAYATGFGIQAHISFNMKSNYDLPRLPGNTRRPATDCR